MGRRRSATGDASGPGRPAWAAVGILLACVLLKAFLAHSRVPFWDGDPTVDAAPETTLTPFLAFGIDALVVGASAWIVYSRRRAEDRFPAVSGVLIGVGCVGVLLHGVVLTPLIATGGTPILRGDPASLLLGSAWMSAMVGAWSLALAARDAGVRRAILAVLISAALILVARGGYQVLVEHPRLIADFEQHRDEILRARGWEPDSATARLFERRLRQAEATGWFGLANAYGSILAMATVVLSTLAVGAWRRWREKAAASGDAGAIALAALIAAIGLCLSGSKGAIGAALLGGVCTVLFAHARAARAWIGPGVCAAVMFGVVARGLVGEKVGELSLLFRWHYMIGAARAIAEYPLLGVGPSGFKDAYLLNKPPLSPEEVESAHSLPLDWLATLGVFGLAWLGVWCRWLTRLGRPAVEHEGGVVARAPDWFWLVALGLPVAASAAREWPALMPDLALLLGIGAIGAWMIGRLIANPAVVPESALRVAAGAGAAGLGAHLMIEVTGTLAGSAGWVLAFIAVAAAGPASGEEIPLFEEAVHRGRGRVACAGTLAVLSGVIVWFGVMPAYSWGAALERAVERLKPVREARRAPLKSSSPEALVAETERAAVPRAIAELQAADDIWPGQPEALEAASRLEMRRAVDAASAARGANDEARDAARRSVAIAEELAVRFPRSSGAWARLGGALQAAALLTGEGQALADAKRAWLRAAELDPKSLVPAFQLCELSRALGDGGAAAWARRTLVIDESLRLDPAKRLTDAERRRVEAIAALQTPGSSDAPDGARPPG